MSTNHLFVKINFKYAICLFYILNESHIYCILISRSNILNYSNVKMQISLYQVVSRSRPRSKALPQLRNRFSARGHVLKRASHRTRFDHGPGDLGGGGHGRYMLVHGYLRAPDCNHGDSVLRCGRARRQRLQRTRSFVDDRKI